MDRMKRITKIFTALVLAVFLFPGYAFAGENRTFIRIDRDDPDAWTKELANVRFLQDERMSGSAQFSENQFDDLADQLLEQAEEVWIVDCRLESHGFVNGIAVSWCDEENDANLGKTVEEVETREKALSSLTEMTIFEYTSEEDKPDEGFEIFVETWKTERELVEAKGLHYLRLICPDHCWPPAEIIDEFIDFAKDLKKDAWLHFHCQAGSGRTGAFMTIYEMMQKPDVPVEEILKHQAETGSGNLLERSAPEKTPAQKERCVLARAVYLYIQENQETGYQTKWSDWLESHSREITLQVGETLEGSGFSSDPLVVSDSLEAKASGQATVLADHIVYFITVQ